MNLSVLVFWFIIYSFIRQKGLLAFMPPGLRRIMTEVSFFDILVNIFIYRKLSKMIVAIFSPFLNSKTPEEVKQTLKSEAKLTEAAYRALFRKGIMNNFSPGMKALMHPRKEPLVAKTLRRGASADNRKLAPVRSQTFAVEDRLDELKRTSLHDLPPIGRSSALDSYFDDHIKGPVPA